MNYCRQKKINTTDANKKLLSQIILNKYYLYEKKNILKSKNVEKATK